MAGAGAGIIVIWNDILADARDDFLEWHSREHIPERVAIPGFVRGQRWFGESSRWTCRARAALRRASPPSSCAWPTRSRKSFWPAACSMTNVPAP